MTGRGLTQGVTCALAALLALTGCAGSAANDAQNHYGADGDTPALEVEALFGSYWKEPDVNEMYDVMGGSFIVQEYFDEKTGLSIPYNLFVPKAAKHQACPMVVYLEDEGDVGQSLTAPLTSSIGSLVWTMTASQQAHPCYVLIPEYPRVIIDEATKPPYALKYVEATASMTTFVASQYHVDRLRLYAVGTSMGASAALKLAASHPDLFAAELLVSGTWKPDDLDHLDELSLIHVAAGDDERACAGQDGLMASADERKATYALAEDVNVSGTDETAEEGLRGLFEQRERLNFLRLAAIDRAAAADATWHLDALRNWLFGQRLPVEALEQQET